METWALGFYMERDRLALLLVGIVPLLVALAYYSGFEETSRILDAAIDAFVAVAIAAVMSIAVLALFGVLTFAMSADEWVGKIALQVVPGSIGALLAQSQFGRRSEEERASPRESGDRAEYFLMCAGALFLSANIAPTEEVLLIALMMSPWQVVVLGIASIVLMHAFVYGVEFRGQHDRAAHESNVSVFVRFTAVGYMIALAISAYICWSFGRFDGLSAEHIVSVAVVLGFPAAIGAASARLIL